MNNQTRKTHCNSGIRQEAEIQITLHRLTWKCIHILRKDYMKLAPPKLQWINWVQCYPCCLKSNRWRGVSIFLKSVGVSIHFQQDVLFYHRGTTTSACWREIPMLSETCLSIKNLKWKFPVLGWCVCKTSDVCWPFMKIFKSIWGLLFFKAKHSNCPIGWISLKFLLIAWGWMATSNCGDPWFIAQSFLKLLLTLTTFLEFAQVLTEEKKMFPENGIRLGWRCLKVLWRLLISAC